MKECSHSRMKNVECAKEMCITKAVSLAQNKQLKNIAKDESSPDEGSEVERAENIRSNRCGR